MKCDATPRKHCGCRAIPRERLFEAKNIRRVTCLPNVAGNWTSELTPLSGRQRFAPLKQPFRAKINSFLYRQSPIAVVAALLISLPNRTRRKLKGLFSEPVASDRVPADSLHTVVAIHRVSYPARSCSSRLTRSPSNDKQAGHNQQRQ